MSDIENWQRKLCDYLWCWFIVGCSGDGLSGNRGSVQLEDSVLLLEYKIISYDIILVYLKLFLKIDL